MSFLEYLEKVMPQPQVIHGLHELRRITHASLNNWPLHTEILRTLPLCVCPPNSILRRIPNETDVSGLLWHRRIQTHHVLQLFISRPYRTFYQYQNKGPFYARGAHAVCLNASYSPSCTLPALFPAHYQVLFLDSQSASVSSDWPPSHLLIQQQSLHADLRDGGLKR